MGFFHGEIEGNDATNYFLQKISFILMRSETVLARMLIKSTLLSGLVVFLLSGSANADLVFQIQRISSTEAILTGSGTVGSGGPFNSLFLEGAAVSAPSSGPTNGDFVLGNFVVENYLNVGGTISFPDADGEFLSTDTPTGSETIFNIDFGNPGRSGNITTAIAGGNTVVIGTWSVVPEPGSGLLLGVIASVGLVARRRNNGSGRSF